MQANWSLVLNVLLLIGVFIAIGRMMKARRQNLKSVEYEPSIGQADSHVATKCDDIIAVRKIKREFEAFEPISQLTDQPPVIKPLNKGPLIAPSDEAADALGAEPPMKSVLIFLLAKDNRQLAGYELLQTVLAAGLRFGEGHLFHRHQFQNGKGPVLFSLAAATPSGMFDLQNIGAFSVHGLCLFMHASGNTTIDAERFTTMLDAAKQLGEGLNTHVLDDQRQPLSERSLARYRRFLNIEDVCEPSVSA